MHENSNSVLLLIDTIIPISILCLSVIFLVLTKKKTLVKEILIGFGEIYLLVVLGYCFWNILFLWDRIYMADIGYFTPAIEYALLPAVLSSLSLLINFPLVKKINFVAFVLFLGLMVGDMVGGVFSSSQVELMIFHIIGNVMGAYLAGTIVVLTGLFIFQNNRSNRFKIKKFKMTLVVAVVMISITPVIYFVFFMKISVTCELVADSWDCISLRYDEMRARRKDEMRGRRKDDNIKYHVFGINADKVSSPPFIFPATKINSGVYTLLYNGKDYLYDKGDLNMKLDGSSCLVVSFPLCDEELEARVYPQNNTRIEPLKSSVKIKTYMPFEFAKLSNRFDPTQNNYIRAVINFYVPVGELVTIVKGSAIYEKYKELNSYPLPEVKYDIYRSIFVFGTEKTFMHIPMVEEAIFAFFYRKHRINKVEIYEDQADAEKKVIKRDGYCYGSCRLLIFLKNALSPDIDIYNSVKPVQFNSQKIDFDIYNSKESVVNFVDIDMKDGYLVHDGKKSIINSKTNIKLIGPCVISSGNNNRKLKIKGSATSISVDGGRAYSTVWDKVSLEVRAGIVTWVLSILSYFIYYRIKRRKLAPKR